MTYSWDFGDGETGEGERITPSLRGGVGVPVTLRVVDDGGAEDSLTRPVVAGDAGGRAGRRPSISVGAGTSRTPSGCCDFSSPEAPARCRVRARRSRRVPNATLADVDANAAVNSVTRSSSSTTCSSTARRGGLGELRSDRRMPGGLSGVSASPVLRRTVLRGPVRVYQPAQKIIPACGRFFRSISASLKLEEEAAGASRGGVRRQ